MGAVLYPVSLIVEDRPCLVVGGGSVATNKTKALLNAFANVTIVSPTVTKELEELYNQKLVNWEKRHYRRGDPVGYFLVISATSDPSINKIVALDAERARVWVNCVDDPVGCSFFLPAVLRKGDLVISVATGGISPAICSWLTTLLEDLITKDHLEVLDIVSKLRSELKSNSVKTDSLNWSEILNKDTIEEFNKLGKDKFAEKLRTWIKQNGINL